MSVKLHGFQSPDKYAADMADGEMAVIVDGGGVGGPGVVVQRYYDNLILVGRSGGSGCSGFFCSGKRNPMRVRTLKPGELLEVC